MADLNNLKATIDANIRSNGEGAITGEILNDVLNTMVDGIGGELDTKVKVFEAGGVSYAEAAGLSTDQFSYALPDTANGNEDDVIITKTTLKTINGESLYGKGDLTIQGGESYDDTGIREQLTELSVEIEDVSEEVTKSASAVSGTIFKLIKGSYVATSGAIVADGAAYRTDYVDVTATFKVKGRGSFYGNGLVLAFFDKDKNFIDDGWVRGTDGNPMKDFDSYIPAEAQYAIVSAYGATNAELSYLQTTGLIGLAKKDVHKKVLVFGDSITETQTITFASEENPYSLTYKKSNTNWVDYFQKQQNGLVQFDEIRNYARSGARFIKVSSGQEARQFIGFQIDEAIADLNAPSDGYFYGKDFQPDIIVVSMGTNDYETVSSKSYEDAMARSVIASGGYIDVDATIENLRNSIFAETVRKSFMRIKKQFPLAKCYMCLPLQRGLKEFPSEILECLRKMSARYGFTIIDCYGESGITRDFHSVYLQDSLHPNDKGKEVMGRYIVNRILADNHY